MRDYYWKLHQQHLGFFDLPVNRGTSAYNGAPRAFHPTGYQHGGLPNPGVSLTAFEPEDRLAERRERAHVTAARWRTAEEMR